MSDQLPKNIPDASVQLKLPSSKVTEPVTGERYVPSQSGEIALEHQHRYLAASLLCADKDVLDIACGEGYGSFILGQTARSVCGVDIDGETIIHAEKRYGSEKVCFYHGSCQQIPAEDASFDIVVSFETLEHFYEQERFFAEIKRVLRPGGMFIISSPDKEVYNRQRREANPFHIRELTKEEFLGSLHGYFRHLELAGQRTMFASIIAPFDSQKVKDVSYGSVEGDDKVVFSPVPSESVYLIALCSDEPINSAMTNIFEGRIRANVVSSLEDGIRERDDLIKMMGEERRRERERSAALIQSARAPLEYRIRSIETQELRLEEKVEQLAHQSTHILELEDQLKDKRKEAIELREREIAVLITRRNIKRELQNEKIKAVRWELAAREAFGSGRPRFRKRVKHRLLKFIETPRILCRGIRRMTKLFGAAMWLRPQYACCKLKEYVTLTKSELFDVHYYYRHSSDVAGAGVDPIAHYLRYGVEENRNPHPLFDTSYYLILYSNSLRKYENPFCHFIKVGGAQGFSPCVLFDSEHYLRTNPDVKMSGVNPLWHYLRFGSREGRTPHLLFDGRYYEDTYPDVLMSGANPLIHFLLMGAAERRNPHPLVNCAYYCKQTANNTRIANPLIHYLHQGAHSSANPHPLFDTVHYVAQFPSLWGVKNVNPLMHYLREGIQLGIDPSPLFDSEYYRKAYPDTANQHLPAILHYIFYGGAEGRNPCALFDSNYYTQAYPDVLLTDLTPLAHYVEYGISEGRKINGFNLKSIAVQAAEVFHRIHVTSDLESYAANISLPAPKSPEISIVIAAYNNLAYTLRCVRSIQLSCMKTSYEVIVVDDCSNDHTQDVLQRIHGLRYVRNKTNQGFLHSCNEGAAVARGKYILLLNNDTCVLPGSFDSLVQTFESHPDTGFVGAKLVFPDGKLQEAGGILWSDASGWNYGKYDAAERYEYNYLREPDYCSGACVIIPTKLWHSLNGFDSVFAPAYYEDADLAFRVRDAGYKVIYQPACAVVHYEGASCGRDLNSGVKKQQVLNQPRFVKRWESTLRTFTSYDDEKKRYLDRGDSRSLLVVDATTPTPDRDAGSSYMLNLMKIFRTLGYRVTFIPAANFLHFEHYSEALQQEGIECVFWPFCGSVEQYLRDNGKRFDTVMLCRAPIALRYIEAVREYAPDAKIIFQTIDLHFLRKGREAVTLKSKAALTEAEELKINELSVIKRADSTILLSEHEMSLVRSFLPSAHTSFIPLIQEIPGCLAPFAKRTGVVFVGGFSHPPNVDAVLYLIYEIWPRVQRELPELTLSIVGSNVPTSIANFASERIKIVGYVPNLEEIFSTCRVNVAPLRFGAGMKGKVVTALGYGVPSVVTSVATEGMGVVAGEHLLVSDEPQSFADAIIRLSLEHELWEKLSVNGLEFAQRNFSVEAGMLKVEALLRYLGHSLRRTGTTG